MSSTETPAPETGPFFRLVTCLAIFAVPALLATRPLVEYDTGWHLRTGQWIIENGRVPWHDPFSTVGDDKVWVAYSWLFGILSYEMHEVQRGLRGILTYRTVLNLLILTVLLVMIARRERRGPVVALLGLAAALGMARLLVAERPGLISILFTLATLDTLLQLRHGQAGKGVWLLPLVYVLWANLHIQWVHGLFLLGLGWLAPILARLFQQDDADDHTRFLSPGWWKLTWLLGLCCLATLLTPYHFYLYGVILTYAQQTVPYLYFGELQSMEFHTLSDWVVLGLFVAAWVVLAGRGRFRVFHVLLLVATGYFGFHAKHDAWLIVVAAVVVMIDRPADSALARGWRPGIVIGWLTVLVFTALSFSGFSKLDRKLWPEFPQNAATAIRTQRLAGPIHNHIDWGGFLIWTLPDHKVTIDGRSQLHGDKRISAFYNTTLGRPGWDQDPDLLAAGTVITYKIAPLAELLKRDDRFRLVFEDDQAVVFARKK